MAHFGAKRGGSVKILLLSLCFFLGTGVRVSASPSAPLKPLIKATQTEYMPVTAIQFSDPITGFTLSLPEGWKMLSEATENTHEKQGLLAFAGPGDTSLVVELVSQDQYMEAQRNDGGLSFFSETGANYWHVFPPLDTKDKGLVAFLRPKEKMFRLTLHSQNIAPEVIWQVLASVYFKLVNTQGVYTANPVNSFACQSSFSNRT